jgi:gamma-glutamyltranspeptidase / glutathione hydrolase
VDGGGAASDGGLDCSGHVYTRVVQRKTTVHSWLLTASDPRAVTTKHPRSAPRRRGRVRRCVAGCVVAGLGLGVGCKGGSPTADAPAPVEAERSEAPTRRLPALAGDPDSVAVGIHGAVSSAELNASRVGLAVLERGGNAVDAAVAVGFALSVTHPSAGNIGGGGFMIVREASGRARAIDYREVAPSGASRDMYLDDEGTPTQDSRVGARAAGIPGDVAGFAMAHKKYGTVPWRDLVAPSVRLAREGWALDEFHASDLSRAASRMHKLGFHDSAKVFERADGTAYEVGDVWRQPHLASTLERIAEGGARAFYEGPLAKALVTGVRGLGGIWTEADLAAYAAVERDPVEFEYHGHRVITMPPPSAGGVVLRQILAGSDHLDMASYGWQSAEMVHLYVETLRRTYADRNELIGDPAFVDVPMEELLSTAYVAKRLESVDPAKATPSSEVGAGLPLPAESPQTTHFSVVDGAGNAVSNTYTLNGGFGAKLVVPGTGVILNNEMDDFTSKPGTPNMFGLVQGPQNAIEPGKRMLSSMTPTILEKDGQLRAIVGSPGGPTITTTVAQIVLQLIDYGRTLPEAVASPRIHHQWLPDKIRVERRTPASLRASLESRGHTVEEVRWGAGNFGHANCIEVDPETGGFRAVADTSRDGGGAVAF